MVCPVSGTPALPLDWDVLTQHGNSDFRTQKRRLKAGLPHGCDTRLKLLLNQRHFGDSTLHLREPGHQVFYLLVGIQDS